MSSIGTQFDGHQWLLRMPQLVRYVGGVGDEQYVDDFFEKGTLRLSSFQAFREFAGKDEERGDWSEGRFEGNVANIAIAAMNGATAYVLGTCAVENPAMDANFETGAEFRIVQALEFAHAVSKKVPGFDGGMQGLCAYREGKFNQAAEPNPVKFDPDNWQKSIEAQERFVSGKLQEAMFLQDLRFAHQVEYRFIWWSTKPQENHLTVQCPEAVEYCRRLS